MLIKFVCFSLMLAIVQASPSSDVKSKNDEPTCPQKIAWYRDITNKTKIMYSEYHAKLLFEVDLTLDAFNKLSVENSEFENAIASISRKIDTRPGNSSSDANEQALCDNIDSYRMATVNLTQAATILKSNVLNITNNLEVAKEAKGSLNMTLIKLVNFLFEINMTENAFKDLKPLMKEAETKATQGIQLEKRCIITETGIEKTTNSEPWNDTAMDKEFDDFLKSAQKDIKDVTRALEERDRIASERVEANEDVDNYEDENDGLPIHLHPARTLVNAFKHPALPLTIIGVILIVICGMFVWNWVRPDQWVRSRYARMP